MRRIAAAALLAAMAVSAGRAWADQPWSTRRDPTGAVVAVPEGLAPGLVVEFTGFPAVARPPDLAGWLAERVAMDAAGRGAVVESRPVAPTTLGGVDVVATQRIYRKDGEDAIVLLYYAGVRRDGKAELFRTAMTADPELFTRYASVPARTIVKVLSTPPSPAASSGRPEPPPQTPVTAPGQGLSIAEIDRVGIEHHFGMMPTGLFNSFDVYVLLKDGSAYRDPEVALADLDAVASRAREPKKWGRWEAAGKEVVLTWPGQAADRIEAASLSTCRPAELGLTLAGDYSRTGGAGPVIPGGIVTLTESELHLRRDGTFGRASSTAVGGGTGVGGVSVGGGVNGPRAAGRYRLDGYGIELLPDGAAARRKFFCRYTDDDTMVFVGTSPWQIRTK